MMPNAAYRDGRKLEYAAAADLRSNGYTVLRTAGSHGIVDLIAVKPGELLFIQCKLDGYLTPRERAGLVELARWARAVPLSAAWRKEGRAARTVAYTSQMWLEHMVWTPDHALEAL
jgi:Holliday junction resolvase